MDSTLLALLAGLTPDRLLTIDEHGSKIARNSVFNCHLSPVRRQMAIENSVSIDFPACKELKITASISSTGDLSEFFPCQWCLLITATLLITITKISISEQAQQKAMAWPVRHIKGRLLDQAVILFNGFPFQNGNFS